MLLLQSGAFRACPGLASGCLGLAPSADDCIGGHGPNAAADSSAGAFPRRFYFKGLLTQFRSDIHALIVVAIAAL